MSLYPSFAFADTQEPLSGTFAITIKKDNAVVEETSQTSFKGSTLHTYEWKNSDTIILSYTHDPNNLPPKNSKGQERYDINISINYLKGYSEDGDWKEITPYSYPNQTIGNLDKSSTFDIITGKKSTIDGEEVTVKGWGIYQFTISINGAELKSDYYYIKPENIEATPVVKTQIVASKSSFGDAYEFSLENANDFKYINDYNLKWYGKCQTKDGTLLALFEEDLDDTLHTQEFSECTGYVFKNLDRTGKTFKLDTETNGDWEIWCEYFNSDAGKTFKSDKQEAKTGVDKDLTFVIYIVVGAAVVAIITVTTVAFVRSKKEKIW
jgi:hypothetical protein